MLLQGEFIDEKEFEKTFKQSMKLQENTNVYHDVSVVFLLIEFVVM